MTCCNPLILNGIKLRKNFVLWLIRGIIRTVFVLIQETRNPYNRHIMSVHSTIESAEANQLELYRISIMMMFLVVTDI
jgi:hypothetical protein